LALALAAAEHKKADDITADDLLHYLPMRYEDRASLVRIADLQDGMEASLELYVKLAGGYEVRNKRSYKQRLFIFEISATDRDRTGRDVVVWTFLSGPHAQQIINNYTKRFVRGVRFVAFGKWERDQRRGTFALRLNKPDEVEVLPPVESHRSNIEPVVEEPNNGAASTVDTIGQDFNDDSALAAIHVGRRVPVYRKLGEFRPKQLREIMHRTLAGIADESIPETLPAELRQRQRLINRVEALRLIHFPSESASLEEYERSRSPAHRRLIFEDFFWLALGLLVKQTVMGASFIVSAISLVAGLYFPISLLPGYLRWASDVQPFTPAVDLLRHSRQAGGRRGGLPAWPTPLRR